MKFIKLFILFFFFSNLTHAAKMTWKYGGETVNTTMVQNGDFMSMVGSYIGTNVMTLEGEEMRTNFVCTLIYQTDPAPANMGSCNMKLAGTEEFWVLNWQCKDVANKPGTSNCTGKAAGGTGRFEGVTGKMKWVHSQGFGEGGGTFNLK